MSQATNTVFYTMAHPNTQQDTGSQGVRVDTYIIKHIKEVHNICCSGTKSSL